MPFKPSPAKSRRSPAPVDTAPGQLTNRSVAIAAIAALTVAQLGGLTRYFPISTWTDAHPFCTSSYALHFARSLISSSALARHFRFWSYSPALMAGYPAGTRTEPMGDAVALWFWIWSGFSTVRSLHTAALLYKVFVVGLLVCIPVSMASAALWFGLDWSIAAIAAALAVFGTFNYPGLLMIRAGMFSFLSAAFLCVAWSGLLYHWRNRGAPQLAFIAVSAALLTYLHPLSAILLVPASLGCLLEAETPKGLAMLGAALLAAFVLSMGWFIPVLFTRDIAVHFANWWKTSETLAGGLRSLLRNRLPFPPVLVMAVAAYGASRAPLRRRFLTVWMSAIGFFALLAYFGSAFAAFEFLEPGRFEIAFVAFTAPLTAWGAREIWGRFGQIRAPAPRYICKTLAGIGLLYFALVSAASVLVETGAHGSIATTLPDQAREIQGWVNASDRDSRIVLESGYGIDKNGGVTAPYFNSDMALLWALESGREIIGGSPSEGFSSFSFADVGNGVAFGRRLADWIPADFRRQLETYNVGAVIAWSTDGKQFFDQIPGLVPLQRSDPFMLYGVAGQHTFLMEGQAGSVSASQDCIEIRGAEPGRLIVKYHYFKTLRADPPVAIAAAALDNGDPNPFIQVDNDARRDIRIYNAGFTGWGRAGRACD